MSERTLRLVHSRPAPRRREPVVPNGVFGMILFAGAEIMLFLGMVSAQMVIRANASEWPPPGQPRLPVEQTALNTSFLLLSGVALAFALRRFKAEPSKAKVPLLATMGLGALFVGLQGAEWVRLIAQGLTLTSSTHGGFFYLIIGTHALHALAAIASVVWATRRLLRSELTLGELQAVAVFWYFVVGIWPFLYWKVYL